MKKITLIAVLCCTLLIVLIALVFVFSGRQSNTANPENKLSSSSTQLATPFEAKDKNGKDISFSAKTIQKPTLLVFWADWCPHCQREFPIIEEVWQEQKEKIDIVAIRVFYDSGRKVIINESDFSFPIVRDGQSIGDFYQVTSIPTLVFVDKNFSIRERWEGELSKSDLLQKVVSLQSPQAPAESKSTAEGIGLDNLFPNFTLTDVDNREITRGSLKGKPAIIWFTTAWCVPCQIGARDVSKLDNDLGGKSFDVLVIFVDPKEKDEDLINWRKEFANEDWIVAFDNELTQLATRVNLRLLDSKFLLDKNGIIKNIDFQIADENYLNTIRGVIKEN